MRPWRLWLIPKTGVPKGVNAVGMAGSAKHGTIAVQLFARVNPGRVSLAGQAIARMAGWPLIASHVP